MKFWPNVNFIFTLKLNLSLFTLSQVKKKKKMHKKKQCFQLYLKNLNFTKMYPNSDANVIECRKYIDKINISFKFSIFWVIGLTCFHINLISVISQEVLESRNQWFLIWANLSTFIASREIIPAHFSPLTPY